MDAVIYPYTNEKTESWGITEPENEKKNHISKILKYI